VAQAEPSGAIAAARRVLNKAGQESDQGRPGEAEAPAGPLLESGEDDVLPLVRHLPGHTLEARAAQERSPRYSLSGCRVVPMPRICIATLT
jgi:hypothetical protein